MSAGTEFCGIIESPIGRLVVRGEAENITQIAVCEEDLPQEYGGFPQQYREELIRYFKGELKEFGIPICPKGTEFQHRVWDALRRIPYGETRSYREIAEEACGSGNYARAVASAAHRNPVLILIPCHRMIGANGSLTGFAAGLSVKKYLLELERSILEL